MPASFAAAVSSHPVTAHATGEVIGAVLEAAGAHADLLVLAATPGHAGALEDVAGAVRSILAPTVLVGTVAGHLAAGSRAVLPSTPGGDWGAPRPAGGGAEPAGAGRGEPALALWSATVGPVRPVRLPPGTSRLTGADPTILLAAGAGVSVSEGPLAGVVTGGPLVLDGAVFSGGAVGVALSPGAVRTAGAARPGRLRPLGPPVRVGAAGGRVVADLDGQPALDRLIQLARDGMPAGDLPQLGRGLHLAGPDGPVAVLGTEGGTGALVLDREVPDGSLGQFLVPADAGVDAGGAGAALVLGPGGRHVADLPAATLWIEAPTGLSATVSGTVVRQRGAAVALFPEPWAATI